MASLRLVALGRALRRTGAAADVGGAVEAVLGEDPQSVALNPKVSGREATQNRIGRVAMRQHRKDYQNWAALGLATINACGVTLLANLSSGQSVCRMWPEEGFGLTILVRKTRSSSQSRSNAGRSALSTAAWYAGSRTSHSSPGGIEFERQRRSHSPAQPHHRGPRHGHRRPCPARPRRLCPYHVPAVGQECRLDEPLPPATRGSAMPSPTADSPSCWPACGSSATGT